jgi:ornithine carbamoyltransferase
MTLKENFGKLQGVTLSYLGDGNNILHSLLLMAPQMGIQLRYACPAGYRPNADILKRAKLRAAETSGSIVECGSAMEAASNAHAVYTDVWTSMGFEAEEKAREKAFAGFQLNENLMSYAQKDAVVLHCLPMNRGKEISETLPDSKASVIFQQSENRLHAQKALLVGLMANGVT